ncbi:PspC domain-containing protein [Paenibacillus soyae]|uniref:PspC domain-containing protein n=1 Tax=Paenibacillus soyae TaxID=2969249 RepID=A0A9X2S909_9BACL|nr:PspC domain-containing protein [Paenibacillus soyae]MCR2802267.1 PspC domain-containing protein [Paenibacillus soyae]
MRKLYRSRRDKKILGLCGGLSEMLNVDATLLRILLIVITVLSSGMVIFIYIIAGLVVPKEPPVYGAFGPYGYGNGPGNGFGNGYSGGYGQQGGFNQGPFQAYPNKPQENWDPGFAKDPAAGSQFDSMMDDLEKKALRREIEELKAKLAKQEKGE